MTMTSQGSPSSGNGANLWARQSGPEQERVTARARKVVERLPSWEPLPPGEILVRRPQR
jgi:hypothetical protein